MRTVRVLTHVKKLDDALGDFIVRVTCPCGASCKPHTCPCCSRGAMPGLLLRRSFVTAVGLFVMSYAGIAISLWPMIVPHRYSLWEAASSTSTQVFLLVGTAFLLPIIFMYTAWSYWVFRGKVRADIGYH